MRRSTHASSLAMCVGLALTYLLLPEGGSTAIFHFAAVGALVSIGGGVLLESPRGLRSIVRTDLIMIGALFALTLVEFFFPQEGLDFRLSAPSATYGVLLLFLGFTGLIIGRNFAPASTEVNITMPTTQLSSTTLFHIFLATFFLGYLNMLIAVNFNPLELVNQMLAPRFSQPWQRGRFGGLYELFYEFCRLILYLVPAVAGSILANPSKFKRLQLLAVGFGLALTLFYGFSSGTRNIFCIYLLIFLATYILSRPSITWKHTATISVVTVLLLYIGAYYMLQFRRVGLENYMDGRSDTYAYKDDTLFIDLNLLMISRLTDVFPERHAYLGSEFVVYAILLPVPRALWPSKPEELSYSAEKAFNTKGTAGTTIASTFVGEAYMTGGPVAVLIVGLLLGWVARWWDRFALDFRSNAKLVLYASGFFAAALTTRSMLFTTTAILPTLALWLYFKRQERRLRRSQFQSMRDARLRHNAPR